MALTQHLVSRPPTPEIQTLESAADLPSTGSSGDKFAVQGELYEWIDGEWVTISDRRGSVGKFRLYRHLIPYDFAVFFDESDRLEMSYGHTITTL